MDPIFALKLPGGLAHRQDERHGELFALRAFAAGEPVMRLEHVTCEGSHCNRSILKILGALAGRNGDLLELLYGTTGLLLSEGEGARQRE